MLDQFQSVVLSTEHTQIPILEMSVQMLDNQVADNDIHCDLLKQLCKTQPVITEALELHTEPRLYMSGTGN